MGLQWDEKISGWSQQLGRDVIPLKDKAQAEGKVFAVEVIADNSGTWVGNGLTFPTAEEAVKYGNNLASRWTLVREFRLVLKDKPVAA